MPPRISGGKYVDMFSNEFRARLSLIMSPLPSSICLSKARIESMLFSWPILVSTLRQYCKIPKNASTYIDTNPWLRLWETDGSSLWT